MSTLADIEIQLFNLTTQVKNLESALATTNSELETLTLESDNFYILWAAVLVFLMQGGFAMLEAGFVRSKNSINILLKNLMAPTIGVLFWYLIGFGIFEDWRSGNGFIGTTHANFALSDIPIVDKTSRWILWFYQFTYAANAATIASGAIAERCNLLSYSIYVVWIISWVYPVVAHWCWSASGWLSDTGGGGSGDSCCFISNVGYLDFAGSGVIHLLGGMGGLTGCLIIGPRVGRFDSKAPKPKGHNLLLSGLGVFLLWFGWFGFNAGSTIGISIPRSGGSYIASIAADNTLLAGALGGITALAVGYAIKRVASVEITFNGILIGLVSITGPCAFVDAWAAVIIGIVSGLMYVPLEMLCEKIKLDDPLLVFPVHAIGGLWGVIAVALFASERQVKFIFQKEHVDYGLFMGGGGELLATQVIAAICIIAWSGVLTSLLWFLLKFAGLLRVSEMDERVGLDIGLHGAHAYNELAVMSKVIAELAQSAQGKPDREDA